MPDAPKIENVDYDTSVPLMDREQIDMLLMLDERGDEAEALVRELFTIYKTESEEKLSGLERICRDRDPDALRKTVHFIAGSAGNLGMMRLSSFYRGIERSIDAGMLEDYEACARLIPREFERSCQQFKQTMGLD